MKQFILGFIIAANSTTALANILDELEGRWEAEVTDENSSQYSLENLCGDRPLDIQINRSTRELVANLKGEPELRYTIEDIAASHVAARPKDAERDENDIGKNLWYFMLAKPNLLLWFDYGKTRGIERTYLNKTWHRCRSSMS